MSLCRATILNAHAINNQLPNEVSFEQFCDNDVCTVLGFFGMLDEIVIVSPRTGLVFTVENNDNNIDIHDR